MEWIGFLPSRDRNLASATWLGRGARQASQSRQASPGNTKPGGLAGTAGLRVRPPHLGRAALLVGLYAQTLEVPEDLMSAALSALSAQSRQHLLLLALLICDQVFRGSRLSLETRVFASIGVVILLSRASCTQHSPSSATRSAASLQIVGVAVSRCQRRSARVRTASKLPGGSIFLDLLSRIAFKRAPASWTSSNQNCEYSHDCAIADSGCAITVRGDRPH